MNKRIKFVEKCTKDYYTCKNCDRTIKKGSSYFSFEEYSYAERYNKIPKNASKICFNCYPEAQKEFRKDEVVKRLKTNIQNISDNVELLDNNIRDVKD